MLTNGVVPMKLLSSIRLEKVHAVVGTAVNKY